MGDKHRSEIQKPVKNTLLSGASHGFPFENFQGSSLLIPVSQDSPSVLNDSTSDINKLPSRDITPPQNVTQVPEVVGTMSLGETMKSPPEEQKFSNQSATQGYTGLFSALFGGGGQKKQESDVGQQQRKNSDHTSPSSISSSPRSSSPFVTIPNIQSFSPSLQVPSVAPEPPHNEQALKPIGFSHSVDSPFSQIQNQAYQHSFKSIPSNNENASDSATFQKIDLTSPEVAKPQKELQNFFSGENKTVTDFNTQNPASNIGFESFYGNVPSTTMSGPPLSKAQSAMELPVGRTSGPPGHNQPLFFDSTQNPPAPTFYQTRSGSADSFKPIQSFLGGPPMPTGAPPLSTGFASKNYRRDHHKRLAYAPVPGLTSNTTVSSSYLQPCNNLGNTSSLSTSAINPPLPPISPPMRQPLAGSVSQPALNLNPVCSENDSFANQQSTPSSSIQSFFNSNTSTNTSNSSSTYQPFVGFTTSDSVSSIPTTQNDSVSTPSTLFLQPSSDSQTTPFSSVSTPVVSSTSVQPPIMSTKEIPAVPSNERTSPQIVLPPSFNHLANMGSSGIIYRPVYYHWFHKTELKDSKEIWQPFSMSDSLALEQAFNSDKLTPNTVVATDGGRYDVSVTQRIRRAVYWEEEPSSVRRCSWFYRNTNESRLHPYDENTAFYLEEEYKKAVTTNTWHRKVDLNAGEYIIMYGPNSMALFQNAPQTPEGWEAEPDYSQSVSQRTKIIKRGVLDDFEIEEGESPNVDHLIFVVHGIGKFCDFKFRTIEEADSSKQYPENGMIPGKMGSGTEVNILDYLKTGKVDGFRAKALQLIKSHFRTSIDQGTVNRVEVLPVSWHTHLHGETTGLDKKLQAITLKSIPKFRSVTNDTLLDILFYTSPVYCQNIVQQVGREITTLFEKFKSRNPNFKGGVSLVGHSLGSLILFDMLCHQKPLASRMENIKEETKTSVSEVEHELGTLLSVDKKKRSLSRNVSYVMGPAGTGQPYVEYPQLSFQPVAFFALGSPIGMFVTVRGIDSLGLDFCFPTCSRFFNVFHPFDPVAYRIEALINPDLAEKRPVLIPHHKGRKRMHLELKETMGRVSASLKQRLVDSIRSTWNTVYHLTMFGRADDDLEEEVDKVIERQLERQRTESMNSEVEESEFNAGKLNKGRRIDYVLQEAPLESVYEYFSAVLSHVIYWGSDDTILLILKEIYESMGISPDNQQSGMSGIPEDSTSPSPSFPDSDNMPSTSSPPNYGFK